ncbi:hypothetical protein TraAM80_08303 [Trypanosoma rangeli]|uniref:Uncharacterized protein n=1 Tax=Trypanosoma rangeli TaxID=5698 RepID=A0A3R7KQ82_TRYRA|nr:uncharacterized protein TraAM80_08303 [Trypanosoma rangeli]RNE99230.1 hypothetical protein TraAM80_08303 [Trypanosoma rangeli]|eukprot:RNE99230.1 hypothetical protein TraAM80_08303 [Trypanosoma rangeli]
MRREEDTEEERCDFAAPTATGWVRILYLEHPPNDLNLSDAERQEAVTLTLPLTGGGGCGGLGGVTVKHVVEAARRQLHLSDAELQLSLHGVVLALRQELAEIVGDLPHGTRQRLVFLLSPSPASDLGTKEEKTSKRKRRIIFADPPLLVSPTKAAFTPRRGGEVTYSPSMHSALDTARGKWSAASQCVFLESWLHPHRCGRCQRVRGQHSVFTPNCQEHLQSATRLAEKKTLLWRHQNPGKGNEVQKLMLPYYYADPQQWRSQRGERYHGRGETCHSFCASWGNPQLCRTCQTTKEMHKIEEKHAVERPSTTPARQLRSLASSLVHGGNTSPPAYARKACQHLVPSSSNEYCRTCYMQRVKRISQIGQRSPLTHVAAVWQRASPRRPKVPKVADWLALPAAENADAIMRSDNAHGHVNTKRGGKQLDGAGSGREMTLVDAYSAPSLSSSSSCCPFTVLEALPRATVPKRRSNCSVSLADIPWGLVLQYTTLDGLRVCRAVSSTLRTAAIPLIYENCRYILDVFDVPRQKRELLTKYADRYASLILDAVHQRTLCSALMDAATHPLHFRCFCLLQFLAAMQVLNSESENDLMEREIQRGKNRVLPELSVCSPPPSPTAHALAGGKRGSSAAGDTFTAQELTRDEMAQAALGLFIKRLAWCNHTSLSQAAAQGIADAFEEISVAAAASLLYRCDGAQPSEAGRDTQQTHFLSLGFYFERHALLPLVDFLQTVEVVTRMKWRARKFLNAHSHEYHFHSSLYHITG